MRKILLLSPHFDDAVLSAGQLLAGRPDADVVTIFAGEPQEDTSTPYDLKCGFKSSKDAVSARRQEDKNALALLGANPIHWDFPDEQYGEKVEDKDIRFAIRDQLAKENYEFVLAPLGLGHPDHITIARIVRQMKINTHVFFWEDMPLRVVQPELVPPRLAKMRLTTLVGVGDGPMVDKIRALSCYRSQIGTGILNPYVMYVPERFWK